MTIDVFPDSVYTYGMTEIPDFRRIITDELGRQGKSTYWLVSQAESPPRNSVYAYLRGERDMGSEGVAAILSVLGLAVRRK